MQETYIHGTHAEEQERLSLMNALMNEACVKEMQLQKGESVLDVGSGLGQLTRRIAKETGVEVLGIEHNSDQLKLARALAEDAGESHLVEFRKGDAYQLPLDEYELETFDVVHSRFLLEHLQDPQQAVWQMVQAVKPNGRILLFDDDHDILRLYPEPAGFNTLWKAYMRAYDRLGVDPYIGRRLPYLLAQAGATCTRFSWVFFGSGAGHPDFEAHVNNLIGVLESASGRMIGFSLIEESNYRSGLEALEAWKKRDDASFGYAMCCAEAVRKEYV
jgi:ubiquinone/menaquinone biosynthesis C-methylase UbiE